MDGKWLEDPLGKYPGRIWPNAGRIECRRSGHSARRLGLIVALALGSGGIPLSDWRRPPSGWPAPRSSYPAPLALFRGYLFLYEGDRGCRLGIFADAGHRDYYSLVLHELQPWLAVPIVIR